MRQSTLVLFSELSTFSHPGENRRGRRVLAVRPFDRGGACPSLGGLLRRPGHQVRGEEDPPRGQPTAMAVLLGHGRGGQLDQGDGQHPVAGMCNAQKMHAQTDQEQILTLDLTVPPEQRVQGRCMSNRHLHSEGVQF